MNNIIPFDFNSQAVRVVNDDNGDPWFSLDDICKSLGLSNPTVVASRLDEDELAKFDLGSQRLSTIVNESGLYSVVIRSDKPEAKPFKKWITSEVLPSIRKTGGYQGQQKPKMAANDLFELAVRHLNPDPASKLVMLKKFCESQGESATFLPDYAESQGTHHSLSELLKKHGSELSARKANSLLVDRGLLEVKTRQSKTKGTKSFKAVTEIGQKYGCNLVNPNNPNETQAHWYDETFGELLALISEPVLLSA